MCDILGLHYNRRFTVTNSSTDSRYTQRGVSADKAGIHKATARLDPGLYPGSFCKVSPDLAEDPNFCTISHPDGSGSKAVLAYLASLYTSIPTEILWGGINQDSLIMNFDDIGCAGGGVGPYQITALIDRHALYASDEKVLAHLINSCEDFCEKLRKLGIKCRYVAGETADLPNQVRTLTVNHNIVARLPRSRVIDASRVRAPGIIVGFSSTGQAAWEDSPNSGMGSNGLTSAIHDLLHPKYRKHTETYAPETDPNLIYCGDFDLNDPLPGDPRFTIATALLSPTRTYLPLMIKLMEVIPLERTLGFFQCSGGGQKKCGGFGQPGIQYYKDNLFPVPPLFKLLSEVRGISAYEAHKTYNMGHRVEAVFTSESVASVGMTIARDCGIEARIIGRVVPYVDDPKISNPNRRQVWIKTKSGELLKYET